MIDSIYTAMSGLEGHQKGLKVISNNVANMNTSGFKASTVDFSDVFMGSGGPTDGGASGAGVDASRSRLDLRAGGQQQTGRDLDLAIDGKGYFVLRSASGELRYTKAGNFEFNDAGALVGRTHGLEVMGMAAGNRLVPVDVKNLRSNPPKVTSKVVLNGNLSTTDTEHAIDALTVYDSAGGSHALKIELTNNSATTAGEWTFKVLEGTTELGTGQFRFENGLPVATASTVTLTLALKDAASAEVEFALAPETTAYSAGTTSTLALKEQDGYAPGQISSLTFDEKGMLKVGYSNGQKADGATLAFVEFASERDVEAVGDGMLKLDEAVRPEFRAAGADLKVVSKTLELSNVNLTQEFSSLILMQRGYQASSQVLSTANEMLQQLFELKGRR